MVDLCPGLPPRDLPRLSNTCMNSTITNRLYELVRHRDMLDCIALGPERHMDCAGHSTRLWCNLLPHLMQKMPKYPGKLHSRTQNCDLRTSSRTFGGVVIQSVPKAPVTAILCARRNPNLPVFSPLVIYADNARRPPRSLRPVSI